MYLCATVSDRALLLGGFKIPPFVLGVRVRCRRMSMDQWFNDTDRGWARMKPSLLPGEAGN
jgi:hypothetical protein